MAALHVRDVPEPVMAGLRERAARSGRSVQQEVREILAAATREVGPGEQVEPIRLTTVHSGVTSNWGRNEIYGDDAR